MKGWVLHAPGKPRGGKRDPLCGQQTGYGAKGCDQALITNGRWAKVTCKKCLRLMAPVLHRLCERCGKPWSPRFRCGRCSRLICRVCAERDFGTWWCTSTSPWSGESSPPDCYEAERKRKP